MKTTIRTTLLAFALLFTAGSLFAGEGDAAAIKVISFEEFENLIERRDNKIYVYNFWATWCVPCVKELPYFEQLNQELHDKNVRVVLVSMDFKSNLEDRVLPFIEEKQLESDLYLLDDVDYNSWIDKVDPSWSGAIPATLVVYNKENYRAFYEQEMHDYEELYSIIKPLIP